MNTFLIILLLLYFLPSIIGGRKRNAPAIFVLNLLLGWTFIGWVVALVWALTYEPETQKEEVRFSEEKNSKYLSAAEKFEKKAEKFYEDKKWIIIIFILLMMVFILPRSCSPEKISSDTLSSETTKYKMHKEKSSAGRSL